MIDTDLTDDFFIESGSTQLHKIYLWARARYAAPWAVFFAVLLRVSASVGPHVRLPGVIGGQASLNLLCAFVSASGGGKGISDKVGRLAWPVPVLELPIGSGEGIAETFTLRGKESEDNEKITAAIFICSEIDIFTGLESRQGSTILGTLKAFAMGEQLGSTNASKATSRNVPAHSYRGCLSLGAQPGHTGVIFNDTSGGTPQRILWAPTIDPDMPATVIRDPAPLDTTMPIWKPGDDGVVEIVYDAPEITTTIISAHLARQRGEADALDGHAMLTRCKVAAILAIMHGRSAVSEQDWKLSETVMAVSDQTRTWIVEQARRTAREKIRNKAIARAAGEEFYDASRLETVKRSILRMIERDGGEAGELTEGDLRRRLGRKEKRELFDQAIALLEADGLVSARDGTYNGRTFKYWSCMTTPVTHENSRSAAVTTAVTHDHSASVTDLDTRRSPEIHRPKLSAPKWLENHLATLRTEGHETANSLAVYQAGVAEGQTVDALRSAASKNKDIAVIDRSGGTSTWDITGTRTAGYQPAAAWVTTYLDALPVGAEIDKAAFESAAAANNHSWTAARHAAIKSGRVESTQGVAAAWVLKPPAETDDGVSA